MGTQARNEVWHKLTLAHFAGNPVYFFDTTFLLSQVTTLAGWNPQKLEAAIAPRVERVLGETDARYVTDNGFYVVYGDYNAGLARIAADEICTDIMRHFFGSGNYRHEAARQFCREASVQELVDDLGIPTPPRRKAPYWERKENAGTRTVAAPEAETEKSYAKQLSELFMERVISDVDDPKFVFWSCWDSQRQRISSFACDFAPPAGEQAAALGNSSFPAALQCELDVMALAAATKAVRYIATRREAALVSFPVSVETLSWSRTRNAYFSVLGQIDPRLLSLLAPRIVGFTAGANLALVSEWIARFYRHVRRSFVHVDANLDFSRAVLLGATGFGITVTQPMRVPRNPQDALIEQARKLGRICHTQCATSYAHNVATLPELYLLTAHGVRVVSGPAVEQGSAQPGQVGPLTLDEVGSQRGFEERVHGFDNDIQRAILAEAGLSYRAAEQGRDVGRQLRRDLH